MNLFLRYIQFDQNQFEKQKRIINLKEFFSKKSILACQIFSELNL
ncbi:hypothetical protein LEP1GSC083_3271 [Leptospira interrogans serovar Pyrogenes str. L0374]|uniref:Uncharacterized protein n=4 Tax=Leptospira interrogans TaxID=173 RepID=A0A829D7U7_LEPIR|nr:hypothetical protein LEP1GSC067_2056 [Leptospira interrogans serovar Lora str. TE 1992]EMG19962.1 hypothetical protein LEP1GSC150_1283 [Leptospira interrogans serovar Copenhageni str. LT2050]EMN28554.1 hypothetical protein LEP1GSC083_3271 [Leptospira interrogans serovar Pyrogenes str. L0374]EMY04858.1 hypothetical protein LEP1GSC029_1829 [Leptospira interrogans str. 2002000626]